MDRSRTHQRHHPNSMTPSSPIMTHTRNSNSNSNSNASSSHNESHVNVHSAFVMDSSGMAWICRHCSAIPLIYRAPGRSVV